MPIDMSNMRGLQAPSCVLLILALIPLRHFEDVAFYPWDGNFLEAFCGMLGIFQIKSN